MRHVMRGGWMAAVVVGVLLASPASGAAQSLGSFRWQMLPYCNVVTVAVVQSGATYTLQGTDDQCGAPTAAAATGLAFQNPNGTIGFGLTIVSSPSGVPVTVDATIALATLSGTWRDSAGHNGTFQFTPGAPAAGSPRPVVAGHSPAAPELVSVLKVDPFFTFSFTPEAVAPNSTQVTVNTTVTGRWAISLYVRAAVSCTLGELDNVTFILVDGVPVRSSAFLRRDLTTLQETLSGLTDTPIAAGTHTVSFGAECRSTSTASIGGVALYSTANVVVHP